MGKIEQADRKLSIFDFEDVAWMQVATKSVFVVCIPEWCDEFFHKLEQLICCKWCLFIAFFAEFDGLRQ
jgi:hypothetical protein